MIYSIIKLHDNFQKDTKETIKTLKTRTKVLKVRNTYRKTYKNI